VLVCPLRVNAEVCQIYAFCLQYSGMQKSSDRSSNDGHKKPVSVGEPTINIRGKTHTRDREKPLPIKGKLSCRVFAFLVSDIDTFPQDDARCIAKSYESHVILIMQTMILYSAGGISTTSMERNHTMFGCISSSHYHKPKIESDCFPIDLTTSAYSHWHIQVARRRSLDNVGYGRNK
jgi:hypothetical protein